MPKQPESQLAQQAETQCRDNMARLVTKATVRVEPKRHFSEWDPFYHRHVFHQAFTVWREFDDIEVTVAPDGRILSFRDKNRFDLTGPPPMRMMSDAEIVDIAGTTGLLMPGAWVHEKLPGPVGTVIGVVRQQTPAGIQTIRFTINQTTQQVAAFDVLEEE